MGPDGEDENIAHILWRPPTPPPRPRRYTSRFHDDVRSEWRQLHAHEAKTFGPAEMQPEEPCAFLRKGGGVGRPRPPQAGQPRCLTASHLPKLPEKTTKGREEQQKSANFVKQNVRSAKGMKPKMPGELLLVDSPTGNRVKFGDSNLQYVYSKNFGIVPAYLIKRKRDKQRVEQRFKQRLESEKPLCSLISNQERLQLLDGLKENWRETHKALLCLPLVIDTITKINKKTKIESKLKELEESIKFVESNPYIYVYNE